MRRERYAFAPAVERTGNVLGHFGRWRGPPREQRRIEPRQNFAQRQIDGPVVMFAAGIGEDAGRKLAQFTEGNFHRAERELAHHRFRRHTNRGAGGRDRH